MSLISFFLEPGAVPNTLMMLLQ